MKTAKIPFVLPGLLACALPGLNLQAQDATSPPYHPINLGVDVGLIGVGGSAGFRFADHFAIAGEANYLPYTKNGSIESVNYDVKLRVLNEPVTLQLYPWANNSFHISLGAAFSQNSLSASASGGNNTSITINGNVYNNPTVNLKIEQQPIDPYVSLGGNLFYFDSAHHWAVGGEIGGMYTGSSKVSLSSPTISAGNGNAAQGAADLASEREKIVGYAGKVKFLPVLKLGLNFSF